MWQFTAFVSERAWSNWVITHCFHVVVVVVVVVKEPIGADGLRRRMRPVSGDGRTFRMVHCRGIIAPIMVHVCDERTRKV
jgi:hypothetical protein